MTARNGRVVVVLTVASVYYAVLTFLLFPAECFWSGDAGVKFVQLESLVDQRFATVALVYPGADLDPHGAAWPFPPPYGARIDEAYYSTFPPYFSIATIPFYQTLGMAGLRTLPFLGGVATLIVGCFLLRQLTLSPDAELVGVALLAFGSPIGFYAATFWEHTPALALCTLALVLTGSAHSDAGDTLARTDDAKSSHREPSKWFLAGACCGVAFALRSESAVFAVVLAGAITLLRLRAGRGLVAIVCFLGGVAVPKACVLGLNLWWFGHPLGLFREHFIPNPASRIEIVGEMLIDPSRSLWESNGLLLLFPVVPAGLAPLIFWRRFTSAARFYALVGMAFVAAMLLLAPNAGGKQFGPRYLLLGVPPLVVAVAATASVFQSCNGRIGRWMRLARLLVLILGAISAARGFQGAWRLWNEKHVIESPMLRVASKSKASIIVSSHPYFPQQAASLYFKKTILRLPVVGPHLLTDLSDAGFLFEAAERGIESLLYVDAYGVPRVKSFPLLAPDGRRLVIEVGEAAVVGHYRFQLWRIKSH